MIVDTVSALIVLVIMCILTSMWLHHREKARLILQIHHMRESIINLHHTCDVLEAGNDMLRAKIEQIFHDHEQDRVTHRQVNARRLRRARMRRA